MKIVKVISIALGILATSAFADEAASTKIATVDMQKALQTVDSGKKAKGQLEKEFNTKKKMLDDEQNAIVKLEAEFKKQTMVLNDEAKEKKFQELQERKMKFQQQLMRSQTEIQQKEGELTAPIVKSLKEMVKEIAAKKNYQMVLDKNEQTVIFSQEKDDLTDELVKSFNAKNKG
jgi:outer membrane protein